MKPLIPIIMGSKSDLPHAEKITAVLDELGIEYDVRVCSAHKTPKYALEILEAYEADPRPKVYITIAGRSNALSGFVDTQITAPNIACPPYSSKFGGADLYSSIRMPSGVAPAFVLEPSAAALLAAKILGVANPEIKAQVKALQDGFAERIYSDDATTRNAA